MPTEVDVVMAPRAHLARPLKTRQRDKAPRLVEVALGPRLDRPVLRGDTMAVRLVAGERDTRHVTRVAEKVGDLVGHDQLAAVGVPPEERPPAGRLLAQDGVALRAQRTIHLRHGDTEQTRTRAAAAPQPPHAALLPREAVTLRRGRHALGLHLYDAPVGH